MKTIITVSEKQIDFLLGKYKVRTHLEIIQHKDSEEVIVDSDAHFVDFDVKNVTFVTSIPNAPIKNVCCNK